MGYVYAGVGALILALSVACYIFYQDAQIAERDLKIVQGQYEAALQVNNENAENAKKQEQREKEDRELTNKALEKSKQIDKDASELKKANHRDPEAYTPAGASWDRFGDRLRTKAGNQNH